MMRRIRLSLLMWGSGFEAYQLTSFKLWDYFANTAEFGADHILVRGAELLSEVAALSVEELLDEISTAIAVRPATHMENMADERVIFRSDGGCRAGARERGATAVMAAHLGLLAERWGHRRLRAAVPVYVDR